MPGDDASTNSRVFPPHSLNRLMQPYGPMSERQALDTLVLCDGRVYLFRGALPINHRHYYYSRHQSETDIDLVISSCRDR